MAGQVTSRPPPSRADGSPVPALGGREKLTRERVLRAALDFVDAHGLAALSMHKLGAALGVKGMSLYTHVDSKDALLDGLVEVMSAETAPAPAPGADWRDALRGYARSLREVMRRHPAAAPLMVSRPVMPASRLERLDGYLQVLLHAGFPEDLALEALRIVFVYAHGHALAEVTFTDCGVSAAADGDQLTLIRRATEMVSRDTPDHLLRLAVRFCGGSDLDRQFDLGIDLMIRGLESGCPAGPGDRQQG